MATVGGWAALTAAMILAVALWWLYLRGRPHAPGLRTHHHGGRGGLVLEGGEPPRAAYWLASVGLGIYLAGTRVFLAAGSRLGRIARLALLVATFQLARLAEVLSAHEHIWLLTGWMVLCAALTHRADPTTHERHLAR